MEWISLVLVVVAVLYFIAKSMKERHSANTLVRFFQYGGDFGKRSFFATLAASSTGLGASVYLIVIYGYFYGLGVFPWVLGFFVLTQAASVYVIRKVGAIAPDFVNKNGTLHEFLGRMFSSHAIRSIAGFMSTITYTGLMAVELLLGYEILRALIPGTKQFLSFELGPILLLLGIAGAVFYYTSVSGFRGVVATDRVQLGLIVLMMIAVLGVIVLNYPSFAAGYAENYYPLSDFKDSVFNASGQGVVSFMFFFVFMNVIFWAMWWPSAMDQWHRVASTRSTESALDGRFGTLSITSVLYFALLSLTFLGLGVLVKTAMSPEDPTQPLFRFLTGISAGIGGSWLWLELFGVAIISLGLVAILVSTLDTYLVVAAQSFVSDIVFARRYKKTLYDTDNSLTSSERRHALRLSKKIVLALGVPVLILFFLIYQLADVFTSIYLFYSFMMALIPALIMGLRGKGKVTDAKAISFSLIGGGIWALVTNLYLVFKINELLLLGLYEEVQLYYNLLYANPTVTAVIAFVIYLVIKCWMKIGRTEAEKHSSQTVKSI